MTFIIIIIKTTNFFFQVNILDQGECEALQAVGVTCPNTFVHMCF